MALMHVLTRVLKELKEQDVVPVIWKGAVLADLFYPDLGTRRMGDIDFAIEPHLMQRATDAFASAGFTARRDLPTPDAIYFSNPSGILFDVHYRVRLFEGHDQETLTIDLAPNRLDFPAIRVLEPNAMFAQLIHHLHGHRRDVGYLLLWLVDLAFVLREWSDQLNFRRIVQYIPEPQHSLALVRAMNFLATECDLVVPDSLHRSHVNVVPLKLDEVLRSKRLVEWGLPSLRGWARLAACRLGVWPGHGRPFPQCRDLLRWPVDMFHERRARKQWLRADMEMPS